MYLKSLVLKGFKSFADRSVLNLEPGMTCIVGPNGSGKSNISDAVLWVFGERSPKNLRGQTMEDVIFAGSSARKAVNVAEVTLVLDNSDGQIPVEYTEIELTRRMYRTGGSDYLINGQLARLSDFLDILHDSGLGTGTHSIISQGNLDAILASRPEDRRALIEEAAGVLKHKQRKEASMRKLDLMDQHLNRVRDIYGEVTRQMAPLERKAKRALTYKELTEEYAVYQLQLAVDDLRIQQRKWDAIEAATAENEARCEELKAKIAVAEAEMDRLSQELEAQSRNREQAIALQARLLANASQVEALCGLYRQRRTADELRIDEEQMGLAGLAAEQARLAAELAQMQQNLDEALAALAEVQAKRDAAAEAKRAAADALNAAQEQLDILTFKRNKAESALSSTRAKLSVAQVDFDSDEHHLTYMNQRIEEAKTGLRVLQDQAAASQETVAAAEAAAAAAGDEDARAKQRIETLGERLAGFEQEHAQLRDRVNTLEAERKALAEIQRQADEAEGKTRNWVLKESAFASIVKVLNEAVTCDAQYERAMEAYLGNAVSALMVDGANLARLSEAVKAEGKSGVLTLLATGANAEAAQRAREFAAVHEAVALVDAVRCGTGEHAAMEACFANGVIVPGLADLLNLRAEAKDVTLVTLAGDIAYPNGLVVLAGESDSMGAISRKRRFAECVDELTAAKKAFEACTTNVGLAKSALEEARSDSLAKARSLAVAEGELQSAKNQAAIAEGKVTTAQTELNSLIEFCATLETKRREAKPLIDALTAEIAQLETDTAAFAGDITKAEEAVVAARSAAAQASEDLNAAQVALSAAESRTALARSRVMDRKTDAAAAAARAQGAQQVIGRKTIALRRLKPFEEQFARLAQILDERNTRLATGDTADGDNSLAANTSAARQLVRDLRAAYDESFSKLSDNRVEKVQVELKVQQAVEVITHDCKTSLEAAVKLPELENRAEMQQVADSLKRRIANLGSVNPEAADEYLEVKKRFDFLTGQLTDLEQARASLKRIDAVIDSRMRTDFVDTFATVNDNFRSIFSSLFPGGTAELVLLDPDDLENTGVEVIAQPKGKRITKMMLMSGGEKSLVALALLFAVYKTRATPFYILDEVEAALDDTNLRRMLAYLDELRNTTQLIMITHQRRTMESADVLFGVSMQNDGVTKVISQRLEHAVKYAEN